MRLPQREWYRYESGRWAAHDGAADYEIMMDIAHELTKIRESFSSANKRKTGTLQFRKLMEEYFRLHLYKVPQPLRGVHLHHSFDQNFHIVKTYCAHPLIAYTLCHLYGRTIDSDQEVATSYAYGCY